MEKTQMKCSKKEDFSPAAWLQIGASSGDLGWGAFYWMLHGSGQWNKKEHWHEAFSGVCDNSKTTCWIDMLGVLTSHDIALTEIETFPFAILFTSNYK